jgi:hypothetical protein
MRFTIKLKLGVAGATVWFGARGEPRYLLGDARQAAGGALHFVAFQFDPQCAELRGQPLQNLDGCGETPTNFQELAFC